MTTLMSEIVAAGGQVKRKMSSRTLAGRLSPAAESGKWRPGKFLLMRRDHGHATARMGVRMEAHSA